MSVVVQEAVWRSRERIGPEVGVPDSRRCAVATIGERENQNLVWTLLNKFAEKYSKRELMAILNRSTCPRPIMSTQDLARRA